MRYILFRILILLLLLFSIFTLFKYPDAKTDESWLSSDAIGLLNPDFITIDYPFFRTNTGNSLFSAFTLGVFYKTFGVGFLQARIFIFIMSVIFLVVYYVFIKFFFGKEISFLSTSLLVSTSAFLFSSHFLRFDIPLLISFFLPLTTLFLYLKNGQKIMLFLSGFFVCLTYEFHFNGILYALTFFVCYFLLIRKSFLILFSGVSFYLLIHVLIHVVGNVNLYLEHRNYFFLVDHTPPLFSFDLMKMLAEEKVRYLNYFKGLSALELVLVFPTFFLAFSKNICIKFIFVFSIIFMLNLMFFSANKSGFYFIHLIPFYCLLFSYLLKRLGNYLSWAIFGILIISNSINQTNLASKNIYYDYYEIANKVERYLKDDSLILGTYQQYLPLHRYNYRSVSSISWYRVFNNFTLTKSLDIIQPDFILIDDNFRARFVEDSSLIKTTVYNKGLHYLNKNEMDKYLAEQGTLKVSFDSKFYGKIELYQIKKKYEKN